MDVIVEDNTAEIGGGIYISESDAVLMNMTIQNNGANLGGGYTLQTEPFTRECDD